MLIYWRVYLIALGYFTWSQCRCRGNLWCISSAMTFPLTSKVWRSCWNFSWRMRGLQPVEYLGRSWRSKPMDWWGLKTWVLMQIWPWKMVISWDIPKSVQFFRNRTIFERIIAKICVCLCLDKASRTSCHKLPCPTEGSVSSRTSCHKLPCPTEG